MTGVAVQATRQWGFMVKARPLIACESAAASGHYAYLAVLGGSMRSQIAGLIVMILGLLAPAAHAELYLMFNVGDTEDREVSSAGVTLAEARAGNKPLRVDGDAPRYFVSLPGATMQTLDGSAKRVSAEASRDVAPGAAASAASMAEGAASTASDQGDTGWVEFEAFAATLFLFSPDGTSEESEARYEPARVFLRRFADGSVYAMITGSNGSAP